MGFLSDTIRQSRSFDELISVRNPPAHLQHIFGGYSTNSGATVTTEKALGLTAVWGCIKILAWSEASLPLQLYERLESDGRRRASNHYAYKLIHSKPNPEQTSFQWRSMMSVHQNLYGAGVSEIEFDKKGYPVALWPIPTPNVTLKRTAKKELIYEVNVDGTTYRLWPSQVVCYENLQIIRDRWISPIGMHRETLGSALAVREFGARTFSQGTNPGSVISYPNQLKFQSTPSEDDFKNKMRDAYEGLSKAHRLMLLDQGAKFERIGLPPEDAQFLETRKWDTAEIARIFNVPLHLLQDTEKTTSWGTGLEELNSGFVVFTLMPHMVLKEQELSRKLIDNDELYYIEHNVDGLLRGKLLQRYQAYAIGRQWGWLKSNQICKWENIDPLPGDQGEIFMNPMNMVPSEYFKQISKPEKDDK
ncbi:MAG: phage portal protein [Chitinispirillaceae bacterium]|nr:phage portal protein [Chitinispirillaceae bacterium]